VDCRQIVTDRAPAALGPYSQAIVADFPVINDVCARHMPDPAPARSAPANVALPRGLLISIDAIAVRPAT
jgi:enamine deaminase RidA (YjgF/YER057c/UK114 family)